ncbi:O-antigen ligase family protein [Alkalihalobacillus trypoxylicola]|uniref:Uncharacterized protein n=1 Tax=Alkalihalobacillus trypoxylicola TaxID=519424 RepID=A0A161PDG0_9BACI|nr:hypothetical protein [Alkalihalobacillus trypoxylicola]KYG30873.1 hypothetical protein AZF04_18685 [Alkalihalobacillus trypoxylicola]
MKQLSPNKVDVFKKKSSFPIWSNQLSNSLIYWAMAIFFLLAPFSVSSLYQKITPLPSSVLITCACLIILGITFIQTMEKENKVIDTLSIPKELKFFLYGLYIPMGLSIVAAAYNVSIVTSNEYLSYVLNSMPTRTLNLFLFLGIIIFFMKQLHLFSEQQLKKILHFYIVAIVILCLVGIWQFLHFLIGYPFIPLSSRAYVHSVDQDVLFNFRLTSLTDEPSFLVPFLVDGIILSYFLIQNKRKYILYMVLPALFVLIFSFSVSGYANLLLLLLFVLFLFVLTVMDRKDKKRILLFSSIGLAAGIILLTVTWPLWNGLLQPILGRFDTLFDIEKHSRLFMLVMPFVWLFDYSLVNGLFGFGPGSYEFLANTKFLYHQGPLSATSNNVFVDLFFEHGVVGGGVFLAVFLYIFWYFFKKRKQDPYYLCGLLLWFQLGITSLYRSDFASPRFWVLVICVFVFAELAKRRMRTRDSEKVISIG